MSDTSLSPETSGTGWYTTTRVFYVSDRKTRDLTRPSPPNIIQIILSTAAPAKFSDAVSKALENETDFDFERDALPVEFKGLLDLPRRVIDVKNDREQVKQVIRENVDKLFSHSAATTTTGL